MKTNTKKIEYVFSCRFYDDEPEELQELIVGQLKNGLFTGLVEHGGKYINTYFFVNGKEIDIDEMGGYDACEDAVFHNNKKLAKYCDKIVEDYIVFDEEWDAHPRRSNLSLDAEEEMYFYNKDMYAKFGQYLVDSTEAKMCE